jgi:hypothetical protein
MVLIKELVRVFIGIKQMSIRRFTSVLKLVDEEEYEKLTVIMASPHKSSPKDVVQRLSDGTHPLTQ